MRGQNFPASNKLQFRGYRNCIEMARATGLIIFIGSGRRVDRMRGVGTMREGHLLRSAYILRFCLLCTFASRRSSSNLGYALFIVVLMPAPAHASAALMALPARLCTEYVGHIVSIISSCPRFNNRRAFLLLSPAVRPIAVRYIML